MSRSGTAFQITVLLAMWSAGCSDSTASGPVCGDGVVEGQEVCDDGNDLAGDGCSATCTAEDTASCGNGVIEVPEECDDGNDLAGDGCSATCTAEDIASCGNGVIEVPEECDDANVESCDGCSSECRQELCGDAIAECDEQCDDGGTVDGDGCSATCQLEPVNCQDIAWSRAVGGTNIDESGVMAIDSSTGDILFSGTFAYSLVLGPGETNETSLSGSGLSTFLARYNGDGSLEWAKTISSASGNSILDVAVATDGGIYVTGILYSCFETNCPPEYYIHTFGEGVHEVTVNVPGDGGADGDTETFGFVARYEANGTLSWVRVAAASLNGFAECRALAVTPTGSVVVGGLFVHDVTLSDGEIDSVNVLVTHSASFFAEYSATGDLEWTTTSSPTLNGAPVPVSIAIHSDGAIYAVGRLIGTTAFDEGGANETVLTQMSSKFDGWVAAFSSGGAFRWAVEHTGTDGLYAQATAIATTASGEVVAGGHYSAGALVLGGTDGVDATLTAAGMNLYLSRYTPAGAVVWSRADGAGGVNFANSVLRQDGSIAVVGMMSDSVTLGVGDDLSATTIEPSGESGAFVALYDGDSSGTFLRLVAQADTGGAETKLAPADIVSVGSDDVVVCGEFGLTLDSCPTLPGTLQTPGFGSTDAFLIRVHAAVAPES